MSRNVGKPWKHVSETPEEVKVYPSLAAGVTIVSGVAFAWSAWVEIIPVNTITRDSLILEATYRSDDIRLGFAQIGVGGAGSEVPRFEWPVQLRWTAGEYVSRRILIIPHVKVLANQRIAVRAASIGGGAVTLTALRLKYVEMS